MNRALFTFRDLCSMIKEPYIREQFERWLIKNVNTFQVEARISREMPHDVLGYEQKRTLAVLIHGIVEKAQVYERSEWLQGDHKFGTIITRRIDILYPMGESK